MSLITKTDVTAVKLFENVILAGIGSYLHVFIKETNKLLQRCHALRGQKIYGIVPSSSDQKKILIFGGKQFLIAQFSGDLEEVVVLLTGAIFCDDWLHAGVWSADEGIALLTAHNTVQLWHKTPPSLTSSHKSADNSILYSGLLVTLQDTILVFSGTVYSEVLVRFYDEDQTFMRLKGHRGVIFSIACDLDKETLVTTSDDRAVRIWGPKQSLPQPKTRAYWEKINIECKHEVYGHLARVMRCVISNEFIVSVGEDSNICFWSKNGELVNKKSSHQNGCIWSVDVDASHIVTGGGDGGIVLHPLTLVNYKGEHNMLNIDIRNPKKVLYTARDNIVILTEKSEIIYYDDELQEVTFKLKLNHESTYILMALSSCKQIVSVIDMCGNLDIFIETCKGEPILKKILTTKLDFTKVLSMQWAGNRHLVLCCEDGNINIIAANGTEIDLYTTFKLPNCKERWLTSSAVNHDYNRFVVGDRCGNVHFYIKGQSNPVKTFSKVHGRYGPTSINIINNEARTTGRDGTIKLFTVEKTDHETIKVQYVNSKELPFEWVEKFIDKNVHYICGFRERAFVVQNIINNTQVLEIPCGGGHRAWDAVKYKNKTADKYTDCIKLVYLKSPKLHQVVYELNSIISNNITQGTHVKEINCLETYKCIFDPYYICVSGGEDTTLRALIFNSETNYTADEIIYKHLSNIRALKLHVLNDNELLIVSAGGRAQICINKLYIIKPKDEIKIKTEHVTNYLIKGTDKERLCNKTWRDNTIDFDPETRIMDLSIDKKTDDIFHIYTGCSDAYIRIFELYIKDNDAPTFKPVLDIKHHETCILKTYIFDVFNEKVLLTCTTTGIVAFWNTNQFTNDAEDIKPFFELKTNKSGINSLDIKKLSENTYILATGGDDNGVNLNIIDIDVNRRPMNAVVYSNVLIESWHSSQITGVKFLDANILLTTSIDQRVTKSEWKLKNYEVKCYFRNQYFSDVADVQGLSILHDSCESVICCVYGKGYEMLIC